MKTINSIVLTCVLAGAALALTSCGTMKGFGQDLEKAGQSIEKKASE